MALIKNKVTKFGIEASYWRVEMITLNYNKKMLEVNFSLNLYLNKGADEFIESFSVTDLMGIEDKTLFSNYFIGQEFKDIRTACYMYAKENVPFFKDAIDDPEENGIY